MTASTPPVAIIMGSRSDWPTMKHAADALDALGVAWEAKVVSAHRTPKRLFDFASGAKAAGYKFPVLIDKGNVLADKLGASLTPEIYYLNDKNVLVYQGAIDNSSSGDEITTSYLRDAVEQNSNGQPVERKSARAVGCSIKRVAVT